MIHYGIKGQVIIRNSKNFKNNFAVAAAEDVRSCRGMRRVIKTKSVNYFRIEKNFDANKIKLEIRREAEM